MSENEKKPPLGELINEEELDAVAGGQGSVHDPWQNANCWFRADGGMRGDGRIYCLSECKGIIDDRGRPVSYRNCTKSQDKNNWNICPCWGTDNCIDRWHKPCGKPPRIFW